MGIFCTPAPGAASSDGFVPGTFICFFILGFLTFFRSPFLLRHLATVCAVMPVAFAIAASSRPSS